MSENKDRLVRQARAVSRALHMSDTRAGLCVTALPPANAVLMVRLPTPEAIGADHMPCRFSAFAPTQDEAIDKCRDMLRVYLARHGLTAGLEALRVTA